MDEFEQLIGQCDPSMADDAGLNDLLLKTNRNGLKHKLLTVAWARMLGITDSNCNICNPPSDQLARLVMLEHNRIEIDTVALILVMRNKRRRKR